MFQISLDSFLQSSLKNIKSYKLGIARYYNMCQFFYVIDIIYRETI